jgi:hypothetical protein
MIQKEHPQQTWPLDLGLLASNHEPDTFLFITNFSASGLVKAAQNGVKTEAMGTKCSFRKVNLEVAYKVYWDDGDSFVLGPDKVGELRKVPGTLYVELDSPCFSD